MKTRRPHRCQRIIRSTSILLLSICQAPFALAAPQACGEGYDLLRSKEFEQAQLTLATCINELEDGESEAGSAKVWAHYLAAVANYSLDKFRTAYDHANQAKGWSMLNNPLNDEQVRFLDHILEELKPEYRSTLSVTLSLEQSTNRQCGSRSVAAHQAQLNKQTDLARLVACDRQESTDWSIAPSGSFGQRDQACQALREKYRNCLRLYCFAGSYQAERPFASAAPSSMTCDPDEIAFYQASPEELRAAVEDAWYGPLDFSIDGPKQSGPLPPENIFALGEVSSERR